jgi:hypothetical protein
VITIGTSQKSRPRPSEDCQQAADFSGADDVAIQKGYGMPTQSTSAFVTGEVVILLKVAPAILVGS